MLEMGLSGLMSGDGKRDGALPSAPALVLDSTMVVEPIELFSARRKTGRRRACEDDGNSAMPSGNSSNQSCDRNEGATVAVAPGKTRGRYSTEFCGSWVRGRSGASCPRSIRRTRPAIAASSGGCEKASWNTFCAYWPRSCTPEENCNGRRLLSTPPSRGQKRGPGGWAHQTRQGDENHRYHR